MRTVAIYVLAALYVVALLWGAAQLSGTTLEDDIARVLTEHSD